MIRRELVVAPYRLHLAPVALVALMGCGDGVTPSLSGLRFDGQAEDSASVLLFSVDFHDGDSDLGGGTLEVFLDGEPTRAGPLDLAPLFLRSGLALDATDGSLRFVLELAPASSSQPPPGTTFSLGVRATDAAAHTSPTDAISLRLTESDNDDGA
jgi:hypothetical protein